MAGPSARPDPNTKPKLRLDKWLWQARFFKTRAFAAGVVEAGRCRVNGQRTAKPGHGVQVGDVLTFTQARVVRVVRVTALGHRRGPASEAQDMYDDLAPVADPDATDSPLE